MSKERGASFITLIAKNEVVQVCNSRISANDLLIGKILMKVLARRLVHVNLMGFIFLRGFLWQADFRHSSNWA